LRTGLATLITVRPICDRLFELGRFDVSGYALSYGAVLNALLIFVVILNVQRIRWRMPPQLRNIWIPFLFMALLAISYAPEKVDAVRKLLTYISFYSVMMLSFTITNSQRDAQSLLKLVVISSMIPGFYALVQMVSGIDWYLDSRIHSTFSHPNIFAFYIMTTLGTVLFLLASERIQLSPRFRLFLNFYLIALFVLLLMTKTRSAWIGCLIPLFVFGAIYDKKVLVFLVTAIPVLALAVPAVTERLTDLGSGNQYVGWTSEMNSYAWRSLLWQRALEYVWQYPILGYGLDSFRFYSPEFFPLEQDGAFAHNVYLQILFETGVVGLMAFLWIFWRCVGWLLRNSWFDRRGAIMAGSMMGAYMVACYSDNLFEYLSFQWTHWFVFGVILSHVAQYPSYAKAAAMQPALDRRLRVEPTGS
jgi:O-antigen ligase